MNSILNKEMRENVQNLSSLIRYNNKIHIRNENVAEHSFYVVLYTMELARIIELSDREYKYVLEHAAIHDVHEVITSDIPHNVKSKFPVINTDLQRFEEYFNEMYFPYHTHERDFLMRINLLEDIVLLADVLSVYQYSVTEISLGNKTFEEVKKNAKDRIEDVVANIMRDETVEEYSKEQIFNLLNEIRTH